MSVRALAEPADLRGLDVWVLSGGTSGEREVSLASGRAIADALRELDRARAPRSVRSIEIDAAGRWLHGERALDPRTELPRAAEDTVCFLGLHGGAGENGTLQGFLELAGCAYTGSGVAASALCMDKRAARDAVAAAGLAVARGVLITRRQGRDGGDVAARIAALGAAHVFVKPNDGGSSVGTSRVACAAPAELTAAVDLAFGQGDRVLVEAETRGVEVSCGVLGDRGEEPFALPPIEIRPHPGRFFDYHEKYAPDGAQESCPPRSLDAAAIERIRSAAARAYDVLGCEAYARIDFIVDEAGVPVFLEANTLPGFTSRSLLPQEAAVAGIAFPQLCAHLLRSARERWRASAAPSTI